jgi:hypothetical protein
MSAGIFNSRIFNNAIFNTGDQVAPEVVTSGGGIPLGTRRRRKPRRYSECYEKYPPEIAEVICEVAERQIELPRVSEPERAEELARALRALDIEVQSKHVLELVAERNRLISAEVSQLLRDLQNREDEALLLILAEEV